MSSISYAISSLEDCIYELESLEREMDKEPEDELKETTELEDASELLDRAMFLIDLGKTSGMEWDYFQLDLRTHLRKWR